MKTRIGIPQIPLMEQTPTVKLLPAILEQQQEKIDRQSDEIEILKEEIKRLKKHKGNPRIKPSQMDKDESKDNCRRTIMNRQPPRNEQALKNAIKI